MGVNGVGRGHAIRSFRVCKKLLDLGIDIYISTYGDGYKTLKTLIGRDRSYHLLGLVGYNYVWSDRGLEWRRSISWGILNQQRLINHFRREIQLIKRISPNLVLSDSRLSTAFASYLLDIPYAIVANQLSVVSLSKILNIFIREGFDVLWGKPDKIFISDLPPPYTISYLNTVPLTWHKNNVEYVGLLLDYSEYEREPVPIYERDIDLLLLISAPRGDKERYFLRILNLIRMLKRLELKVVIIGINTPPRKFGNVELLGWVTNSLDVLSRSKIVMLRGGQTSILEAILTATPMLISPAPFQTEQEGNAVSVERLGIGMKVPYTHLLLNPEYVIKKIFHIYGSLEVLFDNILKVRKEMLRLKGINGIIEYVVGVKNGKY